MVYTDNCPVLNDIEWRDNCQFPVIRDLETPSNWKNRIWNQLVNYRNNNKLTDYNKRYLIARKMESTEGFSYRMAVKVNIAICYSCDQFVYVDKRVGYELYHNYKMEEHWRTNCTGNRHCDICFKEYMELKQKSEVESDIYTRLAIYRYELRIENLINRVKHIRETAKKIRACTTIQRKWLEYFYRPEGMCATELAQYYKLLWGIREKMRQINNV
ncbi:hypothetical protein C2G38_2045717 [Gigaspora rosea]|uniref:Uncharacterized protein n=1 Tax=Gigaspora rosea TaxID=44941 RepID=A0A397UF22_9GLOM|nr:hypothetical protein C2G38_2045717 [Gigaspora rosea]